MITAIVFVKADVARIPEVAEEIAALDGVSEVYSVTGGHNLVAMVRVARHDDLAEVIPGRIDKVSGVASTRTRIAFRAYSRHDLQAAFAIGLDAWPPDGQISRRARNARPRCGSSTSHRPGQVPGRRRGSGRRAPRAYRRRS